jgi:23S rRNA (adenine2503-C2)-methyltransferase
MGEPLNNFESVSHAVSLLTHPKAFGFSRRTVTVSTVGPSPALIRRAAGLPCRLAWSVHAASDELRKALVPTTAHPMAELRDTFVGVLASKPGGDKTRGLVCELALMGGVNDGVEHAEELASLLGPFARSEVLVNLIPYNDNGLGLPGGAPFRPSPMDAVRAFQRRLWDHGILCTVRATRGDDDRAACGQLATEARGGKPRGRHPAAARQAAPQSPSPSLA